MKPSIASILPALQCPLCKKTVALEHDKSLVCPNRHTFDLAGQGYVNFVTSRVKNEYDKAMLTSRRLVSESGFFTPLLDAILPLLPTTGLVLDAGCGEGAHLAYLMKNSPRLQGIGIDLSKDGILLAAKTYKKQAWAVADLSATPFGNQQISTVLNILSPANYLEFKRLLTPHGKVIKVIPSADYLQELREFIYHGTEQARYSNEETVALFQQAFPHGTQTLVRYSFAVTEGILPHIVAMTPLTWNTPPAVLERLLAAPISQITLDFVILQSR